MKKKLLILSASIGLILACFPFTLCAEEDPQSNLGISPPPAYYQLDDYFYSNYNLIPYIESSGEVAFNTGIPARSDLTTEVRLSNLEYNADWISLFGSLVSNPTSNRYYVDVSQVDDRMRIAFGSGNNVYNYEMPYYNINSVKIEDKSLIVNGTTLGTVTYPDFTGGTNIAIFCRAGSSGFAGYSQYRLYSFWIYDETNEEFLRYYYPAKAISSGTLGLYDAVSKTFITMSGSGSISSINTDNTASVGITTGILYVLQLALNSIGDILGFAITEPMIICFMAIGLAGSMFRWARRLTHF